MIQLTRLNAQPLMVNCDLIKFVECAPDTVLTLTTGEKLVVREAASLVVERIIEFRRAVLQGLVSNLPEEHLPAIATAAPASDANSAEGKL